MFKIEYKINGIYGIVEYSCYEENIDIDTLDNKFKYHNESLGYTEVRAFNLNMELLKEFKQDGLPSFISEEIYFKMAFLKSKK